MNTHPSDTCALVRAAVPLLVGDDLEPEALESARGHVEGCPACARALEAARQARAALAVLRVERPAPDVWAGVRAALVSEGRIAAAASAVPRPARRAWRPLVASLAAAGLLSAALWGALSFGGGAPDPAAKSDPIVRGEPTVQPLDPVTFGAGASERDPGRAAPAPTAGSGGGVRLVSSAPTGGSGPWVVPVRRAAPSPGLAAAEPECAELLAGDPGPQALRPSSDQRPRRTVYYQPEGLQGESIDVRQLRRPNLPFGSRAGVQAAGGHE